MDGAPTLVHPSAPLEDLDEEYTMETQELTTHSSLTNVNYGVYEELEVRLENPTFCETCLVTCMHYCDYVVNLNMLFFVIAVSGGVLQFFTNILKSYPAIMDFYLIFYLFVFMYLFVTCVKKCYDC